MLYFSFFFHDFFIVLARMMSDMYNEAASSFMDGFSYQSTRAEEIERVSKIFFVFFSCFKIIHQSSKNLRFHIKTASFAMLSVICYIFFFDWRILLLSLL